MAWSGVLSLEAQDYKLVWSDEFDRDGAPDETKWSYEEGFARNEELQWYQRGNAYCRDGLLVIEARPESRANPWYKEGSKDWRTSRPTVDCTSSLLSTAGKFDFTYGRLEVRARIPVAKGAWPAIWTLGTHLEWPSNGEIDVMEFYRRAGQPVIMANAAWGTDRRWEAHWNSKATPLSHFLEQNPDWASEFHVWRMNWTKTSIRIYLDDELLNEILLADTDNGKWGQGKNPFRQPQYNLLNLAVGGINGGPVSSSAWPMRYEVDY
ncbi:MAG: glycoside hydrolase family 16 protein, partial [Paraprevotella sp.]|nr:glycoside hydrolase family 16 protein [Paraprevotella sp.]